MSSSKIMIPDVDPAIADKLQTVVDTISSVTTTFQTVSGGMGSTHTSVNSAIASIIDISEGKAVNALSTLWTGTSTDGTKANNGMTDAITHLSTLKTTITDNLSAIKTGLAAIATAQSDQQQSKSVDSNAASNLQDQINGLITALGAITSVTGSVNSGFNSISIGGVCSTGIQPGDPLPKFDNQAFMTKHGPDGKLPPDDLAKANADASKAESNAVDAENSSATAEMQDIGLENNPEIKSQGEQQVTQIRNDYNLNSNRQMDRNIATADYNINGETGNMKAISGPEKDGFVDGPPAGENHFDPPGTGNNPRTRDTEYKILDKIASDYWSDDPAQRAAVTGNVRLYSERIPCDSCQDVIRQFQEAFPNIHISVGWSKLSS